MHRKDNLRPALGVFMLPVVKRALPRGRKGFVHWYNVAVPRRSGGIGRRAGLKIRWCESTVSVRARPPVLQICRGNSASLPSGPSALSRLTPYLTPYRKGNHEKGKGRRVRLQEEGRSLAGQILGRWQEEVNLR